MVTSAARECFDESGDFFGFFFENQKGVAEKFDSDIGADTGNHFVDAHFDSWVKMRFWREVGEFLSMAATS